MKLRPVKRLKKLRKNIVNYKTKPLKMNVSQWAAILELKGLLLNKG